MATTTSSELAGLCARVARWRQETGGGRGNRVPEGLWQHAVAVAAVEGLGTTSRATRLSYDRLRARMVQVHGPNVRPARATARQSKVAHRIVRSATSAQDKGQVSDSDGAQFVALQMAPMARSQPFTIELYGRSGERMRIESSAALDLAGVVQAFWSRPS